MTKYLSGLWIGIGGNLVANSLWHTICQGIPADYVHIDVVSAVGQVGSQAGMRNSSRGRPAPVPVQLHL
ncbi:hypothetical protein WJX77_009711 [Trebouxia sp. C0004]